MISLDFKRTRAVDVQNALYNHIRQAHQETHPEAFKWDAQEWQRLRDAYEGVVNGNESHISGTDIIAKYYMQLTLVLTKLPNDIGVHFLYDPANNERKSLSLSNLLLERYCVLYNLGALYNQLANMESRTAANTIKQASHFYQIAAGIFSSLRKSLLHPFLSSLDDPTMNLPPEFDSDYIAGLEDLMLAQAQEAAWQLPSVAGNTTKDAVLARIAKSVSTYYSSARSKLNMVSTRPDFLPSVELQALHFSAVSQYRKSEDDHASHRFGDQITRLEVALRLAKKAVQHAKSYQLPYVTGKTFVQTLEENYLRSKKDNDYIYNQNPPSEARLAEVQDVSMVKSLILDSITDSKKGLGGTKVILGDLLPWGACVAFELYDDRRDTWMREEISDPLKALELKVTRTLTELGLPASLDALNKPTGLPPSMLHKAEEVRLDGGPENLRAMSEDIQNLYMHEIGLLDEALDFLDQEATEDEAFRSNHPITAAKYAEDYPPSYDANKHLTSKAQTYRASLEQASAGDQKILDRIDEHDDNINLLSLPQEELESIVPNSTGSSATSKATLTQSREVRALLEQLNDIHHLVSSILSRADHEARNDKRPRLTQRASKVDMWAEVDPSTFEPVIEEELEKYNCYRDEVIDLENFMTDLLDKVKDKNEKFIASRKDDQSVKARERMLQKLDVAYTAYKELLGHLDEGLKYYNDLGVFLNAFKEECKEWVYERRHSARSLVADLQSLSLSDPEPSATRAPDIKHDYTEVEDVQEERVSPVADPSAQKQKAKAKPPKLPPPPSLYSGDWEPIQLPAPPREEPVSDANPQSRRSTRKKVASHAF